MLDKFIVSFPPPQYYLFTEFIVILIINIFGPESGRSAICHLSVLLGLMYDVQRIVLFKDVILWTKTNFSERRQHFLNEEDIIWTKTTFSERRRHFLNEEDLIWTKTTFSEQWRHLCMQATTWWAGWREMMFPFYPSDPARSLPIPDTQSFMYQGESFIYPG